MKKIYAQEIENPLLDPSVRNLSGSDFFNRLLPFVINWFLIIGALLFVAYFFQAAMQLITSQGNTEKITKARNHLFQAFLGLFIIFCLFAILKIIGTIFGIRNLEQLKITIPKL